MKRVLLLALAVAACTLRGNGERASESRFIPQYFDAVEVFDNFVTEIVVDPELPVGNGMAIAVAGDSNALHRLFVGVHAPQTLSATVDPNHLTELALPPELQLKIPALVKLYAGDDSTTSVSGGAGQIVVEAHDRAVVSVAEVDAALDVNAEDSAVVTLVGEGASLKISATGAAEVAAQGFRAVSVTVDAQGSGVVVVCSEAEPVITGDGPVERRCE